MSTERDGRGLEVRLNPPGPKPEPHAPPRPLPVRVPRIHVPPRLRTVRRLHAIPETFIDDLVIYCHCTEVLAAPGRVEGEALYVGVTDDLDRRRSEHRKAFAARDWEPFTVTLWWPHPAHLYSHHGISAYQAEDAFQRLLLPRYNKPRGFGLKPVHVKALGLHGVRV